MEILSRAGALALDLLFPLSCAACGDEGAILCDACASRIPAGAPACFVCKKLVPASGSSPAGATCAPCRRKTLVYASFSPFAFEYPAVRSLVHNLKYNRVRPAGVALARLLADTMEFYGVRPPPDAVLIPVPLAPARRRTRGFNQSELIAESLGRRTGLGIDASLLRKIKNTRPQMELPRAERLRNVAGAFAVPDAAPVRGRTCVLVDDVKTTGATIEAAARALRGAGAKKIWALTVAH
jgi:ComF family protein